jgi:pimeloyl-ACP methyl ester carboxylesterase
MLGASAGLLAGCMPRREVKVPIELVEDLAVPNARQTTLVVMLPGARDVPQDFMDQGFVRALRAQRFAADMWLLDSHLGYFSEMTIIERLAQDVVVRARSLGYRAIWFAGISLGGYGTLLYSMRQAARADLSIDGFFLMAPYMGPRRWPNEVSEQGGLGRWQPELPAGITTAEKIDWDLWRWLKNYTRSDAKVPQAYLSYGADDRFAQMNALFAQALPQDRVWVVPGGHDWPPWIAGWQLFLERAPWPRLPT